MKCLQWQSCRGKFRSKKFSDIVDEAQSLVAAGAVELNLIAEDVNLYGSDGGNPNLDELLQELSKIEKLRWLRLLYCYPSYFTDSLIEEIATNDKVGAVENYGIDCVAFSCGLICRPAKLHCCAGL